MERKYYYIDSRGQKHGTVEPYNLPLLGVTLESYVWTKGMKDWTRVRNVAELIPIFARRNSLHQNVMENSNMGSNAFIVSSERCVMSSKIKKERSLYEIFKPLLWSIGCFILAGLVIWLIILMFEWLGDGKSHHVRVRVGLFIAPIMLIWEGLKLLTQFVKQFFV